MGHLVSRGDVRYPPHTHDVPPPAHVREDGAWAIHPPSGLPQFVGPGARWQCSCGATWTLDDDAEWQEDRADGGVRGSDGRV